MSERYPRTVLELEDWFGTEAACRDYRNSLASHPGLKEARA